jgi:hypothetical protein
LYLRRPEVESALHVLLSLPRSQFAARCNVTDQTDAGYLPSECLLHVVRESRSDSSDEHFAGPVPDAQPTRVGTTLRALVGVGAAAAVPRTETSEAAVPATRVAAKARLFIVMISLP